MQWPEIQALAEDVLPGSGPVAVERPRQGVVNATYRLTRGAAVYALRVDTARAARLGVQRDWESRVWRAAAAAGIAPYVVYADPQRGIWVSRWATGRAWAADEVRSGTAMQRMADLLRRIHALAPEPPLRCMPPAAWIDCYRGADPGPALTRCAGACLALLAQDPSGPVLCHSDLHTLNLVDEGRSLCLLDWEYAHLSDPFWDVAGWCANNDFTAPAQGCFLDAYLGRDAAAPERSRLKSMLWLYDYVCWLWSERYLRADAAAAETGTAAAAAAAVAARAALLRARLDA